MPKQQRRKRNAEEDNDADGDEPQNKKVKQQFPLNTEPRKDDEGNPYWEISNRRRLQVSEFKGTTMISIREYYEKDGKTRPGKGISLPVEQFNAMCELLPQVELVLRGKDLKTIRPQYQDQESEQKSVPSPTLKTDKGDANDDDDDESDIKPVPSAKGKLSKFKLKANHEATSDEEE